MVYTDSGFVIRKNDLLNEDRIFDVFLKEHGRISCVAKGVKKITSRKSGNLDLLNFCKFSIATGKNLDIITEVKLLENFDEIKSIQENAFSLFYIDEVLSKLVYDGEVNEDIFNLLKETLDFLNENLNTSILKEIVYFNCKILNFSGVFPDLYSCVKCAEGFSLDEDKVYSRSGIAHSRCMTGREISNNAIKALRYILAHNSVEFSKISIDLNLQNNLFTLTTDMIEYTIGALIKSKIYIHGK